MNTNLKKCIIFVIAVITFITLSYSVFVHISCGFSKHDYTLRKTVEETCDKNGFEKYRCSKCFKPHRVVLEKCHKYESKESVGNCDNGGHRVYECSRCHKTYNKNYTKGHDFKYIKTVGHCENDGYKLYQCSKCDESKKEYYEKGHKYDYIKEEIVEGVSKTTFICSKCKEVKVDEFKVSKDNYISTLSIPSIDLKVKVYEGYKQGIVDDKDSAACFKLHNKIVIADHKYQDFNNLTECEVGRLALFNSSKYECINKFEGHNTGKDITDNDGKSIKEYKGDIVMYVGDEDKEDVTVLIFSKIK